MSVAKKEGKANGPDNRVLYALALSFLFHALHVVALPLVVSYDGHLYYKLAMLPGDNPLRRHAVSAPVVAAVCN